MKLAEAMQTTIANNLANSSTPGFKRDLAVGESFAEMLAGAGKAPIGKLSTAAYASAVYFDSSAGTASNTDCPFDFAIEGDGCFAVQTPAGERYTRAGNFRLDTESYLSTADGNRVLTTEGPVVVDGALEVTADGTIYTGGRARGRFLIKAPSEPDVLTKQGGNLFAAEGGTGGMREAAPGEARIVQGAVELSNVNVVREMVQMIAGYRVFESLQRAVVSQDACLDKAVNEVGRVG